MTYDTIRVFGVQPSGKWRSWHVSYDVVGVFMCNRVGRESHYNKYGIWHIRRVFCAIEREKTGHPRHYGIWNKSGVVWCIKLKNKQSPLRKYALFPLISLVSLTRGHKGTTVDAYVKKLI